MGTAPHLLRSGPGLLLATPLSAPVVLCTQLCKHRLGLLKTEHPAWHGLLETLAELGNALQLCLGSWHGDIAPLVECGMCGSSIVPLCRRLSSREGLLVFWRLPALAILSVADALRRIDAPLHR